MIKLIHTGILNVQAQNHTAPTARSQQHRTQPATVNHGYGLKGIFTEGHTWLTEQILYSPNWIIWNQ